MATRARGQTGADELRHRRALDRGGVRPGRVVRPGSRLRRRRGLRRDSPRRGDDEHLPAVRLPVLQRPRRRVRGVSLESATLFRDSPRRHPGGGRRPAGDDEGAGRDGDTSVGPHTHHAGGGGRDVPDAGTGRLRRGRPGHRDAVLGPEHRQG